jgi:hypothetical protein
MDILEPDAYNEVESTLRAMIAFMNDYDALMARAALVANEQETREASNT